MSGIGYKCAYGGRRNFVRCTPNSGPSRLELPLSPTLGVIWPAQVGALLTLCRLPVPASATRRLQPYWRLPPVVIDLT